MPRLALLLAALAFSRSVAAEEHRRIEVVLATDPAVAESVLSVLRASLTRQGLEMVAIVVRRIDPLQLVRSSPNRSPAGPVAHLWLDLAARQPTMYLVAAPNGLVYVRPLAVRAMPDAVEIELIRFVADSSVQAILKGRALGISRDEFERSLAAPVATAAAPAPMPAVIRLWPRWMIAAGYSGSVLSSDFVAHGPEVGAEARWPRLHFGITVAQRFPLTVTRAEVSTRLVTSSIRILAAMPIAISSRLSASFGIGAGADVTHVAPEGVGATSAFWVTDPLVLAMTTLERVLGDAIASVDLGVDWDLLAARYAALRSGETTVLWTPQRWRPFATARLGFSF